MRKIFGLLILFIFTVSVGYSQPISQVKTDKFKSEIPGVEREYSIYLPVGYETSDKNYPVLYLLHGAWGNHQAWLKQGDMKRIVDDAIACGMSLEMIVVMPDARGESENFAGKNMGYFNVPNWAYEDYFFKELVPYIDNTYRTCATKQGRAIAGLSMGGGGTTVYAQRHSEIFGSACSLSGLISSAPQSLAKQVDTEFAKSIDATSPVAYIKNATKEQLDGLKSVRWYFDCGDDDYLYQGNIDIYMAMKEKNVPLQYRMRDGAHTWTYWQSALPTVLQFCSIGFAQ